MRFQGRTAIGKVEGGCQNAHLAEVVALAVLGNADVGAGAVLLPQHDLPGTRVLPEQRPAVVDDVRRHGHALRARIYTDR